MSPILDTDTLDDWRKQGELYRVPPLDIGVFTVDLGDRLAGSPETCLLIHGFPESSFSFHKVVSGLLKHFKRVVLVDLPGYGFSDKPGSEYSYSLVDQADAVLSVYQHLDVTGGHIICHDMGTSVVTELLARYLKRSLVNGFYDSIHSVTFTNGSMVLKFAKLRLMQLGLLNKTLGPMLSRLTNFELFKKTILSAHGAKGDHALSAEDVSQMWLSMCVNNGHKLNHHLIKYLNDRRQFERTRWLPSLRLVDQTLPIHICWGDQDEVAKIDMARYLKESICPNAKYTEMQGAGHFCQLGSPTLWLESVIPFYEL